MSERRESGDGCGLPAAFLVVAGLAGLGGAAFNDIVQADKYAQIERDLDKRERSIDAKQQAYDDSVSANAVQVLTALTEKIGEDAMDQCFSSPAHELALSKDNSATWAMQQDHSGGASILDVAIANDDYSVVAQFNRRHSGGLIGAIYGDNSVEDIKAMYEYGIRYHMFDSEEVQAQLVKMQLEALEQYDPTEHPTISLNPLTDAKRFKSVFDFDTTEINRKINTMIWDYLLTQVDDEHAFRELVSMTRAVNTNGYSLDLNGLSPAIDQVLASLDEKKYALRNLENAGIIAIESSPGTYTYALKQ